MPAPFSTISITNYHPSSLSTPLPCSNFQIHISRPLLFLLLLHANLLVPSELVLSSSSCNLTLLPFTQPFTHQTSYADTMNAYSKMRSLSTDFTSKPNSVHDLSDPTFSPPAPKPSSQPATHARLSWPPPPPPPPPPPQQQQQNQEEEGGERFGVVLSRTCSSASQRFLASSSTSSLGAAAKRAFSMRRASSVREGYWRIHDTADEDAEEGEWKEKQHHLPQRQQQVRSSRQKKEGKILRACRRIFGF